MDFSNGGSITSIDKMPQPYPNPNFNTTLGLFNYANSVTDHWAGIGFIMVIYVSALLIMLIRGYRPSIAFTVGGFGGFLCGSLLWAVGVISGQTVLITLLLFIGAVLWLVLDS